MKKPATLILAALMICMMTCPALAAELPGNTAPARSAELFPSEVVETLEGDHHRLEKIYLLTAADNPSNIPTEDFEREGYHYTLLDVTRQDYTESDVKEYSETFAVTSDSKDMDVIMPMLPAAREVTTEDGYTGMANGELTPDNEGLTSSNGLYTTDRNGQIILSKLLPGTYVVTEETAPDNYQADPTPQTVVVNAGDTQTLRFYDDPLCTLTILKRDAVTRKPLANATFVVRDSEGRAIGPNNGLYTTGTDGTVTVSGLTPNSTVVVSETKAPTGYILDETPKNIVVRSGVANSLIFDDQPGTTLIIRKYIEGTDYEPLPGVCFKVTDGNGGAIGPNDGVYYTDKAGEDAPIVGRLFSYSRRHCV